MIDLKSAQTTTQTLSIYESTVIGVFATSTENIAIVPTGTADSVIELIQKSLGVEVISTLINGSPVIGSMIRGNSNGFLIPSTVNQKELSQIDVKVAQLPGRLTAIGNIVLANDNTALVHPELSQKLMDIISNTLSVDVHKGTIADLAAVGMAGIATNKGILLNPMATRREIEHIEDIFGLPVDIGTVNFGSKMVGSGVLANSKGYVAGFETTGHELGRIEEALDFI